MEQRRKYVLVENGVLGDPNISMKAKGLYAFLSSLPEDAIIKKSELHLYFSDGTYAVSKAIKELEHAGYLLDTPQKRNALGRFN